jgi:predicted phage tail protein
MKTVKLYGPLAEFVGAKELQADVRSPAEAIRFLAVNFPGLSEHMARQHYCVKSGVFDVECIEELHFPAGSKEAISIIPVVGGASKFGKILAGAALIVGSFLIPGSAAILGIGLKGLAFSIGASLVLGGVAEILAPTPKSFGRDERDPNSSNIFSGVANVSRAGVPLPIVYGETVVGSVVVSLGLRAVGSSNEENENEDGRKLTGTYTQSGLQSGSYQNADKDSMTDKRFRQSRRTVATKDENDQSWVMIAFNKPKFFSKVVVGCDFDETLGSADNETWGKSFAEDANIQGGIAFSNPNPGITWQNIGNTGTFNKGIQTYDVTVDPESGGYTHLRIKKNDAKLAITEFYAIQMPSDLDPEPGEGEQPELSSTAYARIIDVLSEGGIEGWPAARKFSQDSAEYDIAALKNIYLNETPILAPGANVSDPKGTDYNFQNVTAKFRYGTIGQNTTPSGFQLVEAEQAVEAKVTKDQAITREITNTNVNEVRVTVTSPVMQKIEGADTKAAEYTIEINAAYGNGNFSDPPIATKTIKNLSDGPYQWSYKFNIDPAGDFPVRVRLRRTADDPDQESADAIQNESIWTSYTEISRVKCAYPGSAYVALDISAEQFPNVPSRRYRIRGRRIRIPVNATVKAKSGRLSYSGLWNGEFTEDRVWCACPAWILYDLLISGRYGLGEHIKAGNLDKWEFYACSQYANEKVDDGYGGQEARFSCNVSIQTETEAYAAINELAGVMRAMPIWSLGGLSFSQDRPGSIVYGFGVEDVEDGVFNYSGSSGKARANVAVVGWFNRDTAEIEYEEVVDEASIAKYGTVKKDITAFACTSRGQAYRLGKWVIASEQQEAQVVVFRTDLRLGIQLRPGDLFTTQDPVHGNIFEQWKLLTIKEVEPEKYEITGVFYSPSKFADIDNGVRFSGKTLANVVDEQEED